MVARSLLRRTFLSLFLLPLLPAVRGAAQESTSTAKMQTARELLTRGIRYERAAVLCREALKDAPGDWQIAATLGCALAARAAAIAYAALADDSLRAARRAYPAKLRSYQDSLKQPDGDKGTLPPREPPAAEIRYKDDGQSYRLTPPQLAQRLTALTKDARAALEQAAAGAKTPAEKAEAAHLQGWGLRLLQRHGREVGDLKPDFPATPSGEGGRRAWAEAVVALSASLPGKEAVLRAFEEATRADPQNAVYWESLSDAYEDYDDDRNRAMPACEKALALKPRNARLWFRLYDWRSREIEQADALALLQNAARYEPGNGWYGYEEAALLVKSSPFVKYANADSMAQDEGATDARRAESVRIRDEQKKIIQAGDGSDTVRDALRKIERSNTSPVAYPSYTPPVPRLLAAAWKYRFRSIADFTDIFIRSNLHAMIKAIREYADYRARDGQDITEAERACNILIACGDNIRGVAPSVPEFFRDNARFCTHSLGAFVTSRGYEALVGIADVMPPDRAAAVEARYSAYQEERAAYYKQFSAFGDYIRESYLLY